MPTGHDHYRQAERTVKLATDFPDSSDALIQATAALVHATLALAAAQMPARLPSITTTAPVQGDLIVDQMGDLTPEEEDAMPCGDTDSGRFCHNKLGHDGLHFDGHGEEFA
jgi:hypothetical protein